MVATVGRVAGEAVLAYVIGKLFDPNTSIGQDLIESITNLSLSILEYVENYSPSGHGSFDAYWTYADLNTKKREAYKVE